MKKITFLMLMGALSFGTLQAQHDVKINMLGLIFGNYGVNYEYVISPEMSTGAGINYYIYKLTSTDFSGTTTTELTYTGFNISPEFRFYFNPDDDAEGAYAGAYLKYRTATGDGNWYYDPQGILQTTSRTNTGLAFGIMGGKKWVADVGFIFETYFGIGKYIMQNTKYGTPDYEAYHDQFTTFELIGLSSIDLRIGLGLGWRF